MTRISLFKTGSWLLLMAATLQISWSKKNWRSEQDWTQCVPRCQCMNVDGRKQAKCDNAGMNDIPANFNQDIQVLQFNSNNITVLKSRMFSNSGLINLQKVYMRNCSIREVDKYTFASLSLLIHMDLSDNEIKRLDPLTFQGMINLRNLYINNNSIERLENHLLSNLPQLQALEFDNNRISHIADQAFVNLPKLKTLKLKNNLLVLVQASIFQSMGNLGRLSLELQNNPWHCDCQLREFFDYVKNNSFSNLTYCSEPEKMRSRSWQMLKREQFTCTSEKGNAKMPISEEMTLSCQLLGNSNSKLNWTLNGTGANGRTFSINTNDELRSFFTNKMVEGRENVTATILKQIPDKTLDEKLAIIINQNELLRRKVEQLEAKLDDSENYTGPKNMVLDKIPVQNNRNLMKETVKN